MITIMIMAVRNSSCMIKHKFVDVTRLLDSIGWPLVICVPEDGPTPFIFLGINTLIHN